MPRGPQGQKRPADVIGNAVLIAKIATGEAEGTKYEQPAKAKSGPAGAKARAESLTTDVRREIGQIAAHSGWEANS